jgi:hypothetical protein
MAEQVSPLRQRMTDDMTIRNMSPNTQKAYVRAVKNFSLHFGKSPDKLSFEDVRKYQLHLVSRGLQAATTIPIMCVRFFYGTTLGRPKAAAAPKATDAEAAQLYNTMVAYAGAYTVEGDKIIHKVDVSWNQVWNGTSQTRIVEVRDNRLMIKTAPFVSPFLNKQIVSTLVFERAK